MSSCHGVPHGEMTCTDRPAADRPDLSRAGGIPVPLLDVGPGNRLLEEEILAAIARVIRSGRFILGPPCEAFEAAMADFCGTRHAVGCASGSDALLLALMALDIGPGDEVIVPNFTFFATASAVWRLGARPVFADIRPDTFNVDPAAVEERIGRSTKAVIPVHLFGQCASMDPLLALAEKHGLAVVEDAAQAIGAAYRGRTAGAMGHVGCFSFYPTKNLGAHGDAGLLVTSDERLAERLRLLRSHGMHPRYYHRAVGINSRLDSIQAAVLGVKLPHLARWSRMRGENAARYQRLFREAGLVGPLLLPASMPECHHVWNQYTLRVPSGGRDALRDYLTEAGVGTEIYYPVPLNRQECFRAAGLGRESFPHTERACAEVLSLPIYPELTEVQQRRVVEAIGEFLARQNGARPMAA